MDLQLARIKLGGLLKMYRNYYRLNQEDMGKRFHCDNSQISRMEKGHVCPSKDYLELCKEVFELDDAQYDELVDLRELADNKKRGFQYQKSKGRTADTLPDNDHPETAETRESYRDGTSLPGGPISGWQQYSGELEKYFTGQENLRGTFRQTISVPKLEKPILIVYGVGGVGKSSLLAMFGLDCVNRQVPAGIASGESVTSAVDILTRWYFYLNTTGVELPIFAQTLQYYRLIQAKATSGAPYPTEDLSGRQRQPESYFTDSYSLAADSANRQAVHGRGFAFESLESNPSTMILSKLRDNLSGPEIDLLLNSAATLTHDFLKDITYAAKRQRVVLMLDAFEKMSSMDNWVCAFAHSLPSNVLMVVAGRDAPSWDRCWEGWLTKTEMRQLDPMDEVEMRELVYRYHYAQTGEKPDAHQIVEIVDFAKGLPLAVTTAISLWIKYGAKNLKAIEASALSELVRQLREDVPNQLIPILEAAAVLRHVNKSILRAIGIREGLDEAYLELQMLPFVKPGSVGNQPVLQLHDSVRELFERALQVDDPERYRELHRAAAKYFEHLISELGEASGFEERWQRLTRELIYHSICYDENAGMNLLHQTFRQHVYVHHQFCRVLLDDASSSTLEQPRNVHRLQYEYAWLTERNKSPAFIDDQKLKDLVDASNIDPTTQWELYQLYGRYQSFNQQYDLEREYFRKSVASLEANGQEESAAGCLALAKLSQVCLDDPHRAEALARRSIDISGTIKRPDLLIHGYLGLGTIYQGQRRFAEAEAVLRAALPITVEQGDQYNRTNLLIRLAQICNALENFGEANRLLNLVLETVPQFPEGIRRQRTAWVRRNMAINQHLLGNYDDAIAEYRDAIDTYRHRRSTAGLLRAMVLLASCLYDAGRTTDITRLRGEIDELASRTNIGAVVAAWLTLLGHLSIDALENDQDTPARAIELYQEALLEVFDDPIPEFDEIANRIFWRVALLTKRGHRQDAHLILRGLIDCWENQEHNSRRIADVEWEKRERFSLEDARLEDQLLARMYDALENGLPDCKPAYWLDY